MWRNEHAVWGRRLQAVLPILLAPAAQACAASVTVIVENVRNDNGHVRVAICTRADFLHPHCQWQGAAPARKGETVIAVSGVPPGIYAAEAYQDEDDNGRLDRNFLGLPAEGMGFSNNARMMFGPPRFDAAAFTVSPEGTTIRFALKYY